MQIQDAAGRKVSLLNDDSSSYERPAQNRNLSFQSYPSPRSNASSPDTPELLRSDSYDSQMSSNDPISPTTPSVDFGYTRPSLYHLGQDFGTDGMPSKRPSYTGSNHSASFDEDASSSMADRPGKRYPCRYRDSHGCDKTFTTSGHASRHSKIHTAEKAVQCTFSGCSKKFTRADNMKQHLETHYKDKSRSSSQRTHKAALTESRRTHSSSSRSRSSGREATQWETEQYHLPTPPLPSANGAATSTWDMRGMNLPLHNRPAPTRQPSSGLDALAMAVACQEGGR